MKTCLECGRKLGTLQGYYHPAMGREYFVCGNCFETVAESVERYREFVSPYIGFFNKETTLIEDIEKIGEYIKKNIKKAQSKVSNLSPHKTTQNADGTSAIIN
jgi:hypothetical protein